MENFFNKKGGLKKVSAILLFSTLITLTIIAISNASTTTILQDANSENLKDSYVSAAQNTVNYGSGDMMEVSKNYTTSSKKSIISFNLSSINVNASVINAKLWLYRPSTDCYGSGAADVAIYLSKNDSWNESTLTWNNFSEQLSINSFLTSITLEDSLTGSDVVRWYNFTINNSVVEGELPDGIITFIVYDPAVTSPQSECVRFATKENANTTIRPYLNITYDDASPTYSSFTNNASTVTVTNGFVKWNISITDDVSLGNYSFRWNDTGNWSYDSTTTFTSNPQTIQINKTVTATQGKTICGQFMFNDSSSNYNETNLTDTGACFVVANTPATEEEPTVGGGGGGGNFNPEEITCKQDEQKIKKGTMIYCVKNIGTVEVPKDESINYSIHVKNTVNTLLKKANARDILIVGMLIVVTIIIVGYKIEKKTKKKKRP